MIASLQFDRGVLLVGIGLFGGVLLFGLVLCARSLLVLSCLTFLRGGLSGFCLKEG